MPFAGLDIEGIDAENLRIEYNPNRPDFSSQYGIVRALKGLLEIEVGLPKFKLSTNNRYVIKVNESVKQLRPYIVSLVATRKENLTSEDIKELIATQEDLHNGICRHRKKASIGIHNLDKVQFPLTYTTAEKNFSFVPLDRQYEYTIKQILDELDSGKEYGTILGDVEKYPIIVDSNKTVLSFPPIVNSNTTRLGSDIKNILVEITAINKHTAEDTIDIIGINLFDAGFNIHPVIINYTKPRHKELTPNMKPKSMQVDADYINRVLGTNLTGQEISFSLKKSRLGTSLELLKRGKLNCSIPRYRTDIYTQIDIVEEAALGYGIFNLQPSMPCSKASGTKSKITKLFNAIREILVGMEMLEIINFSLVSKKVQFKLVGEENNIRNAISVDETKSIEYEVLRNSLIPSLLQTLSHNVHEEYPQRLFEIGKVFRRSDSIKEHWNVGVVIAYNSANYTAAKSTMQELVNGCFGPKYASAISTPAVYNAMFMEGRCAHIDFNKMNIGIMGEISPVILQNFKLRVPVAAIELDLSSFPEKLHRR
jgi:phenylalanyl-tRNA synthetase beta chain